MKKRLIALLAIVATIFTAPLRAQQTMGAINTPQVNSTFYVGSVPGFNSTIQATVTAACAAGGNRVIDIPAGYAGTDLISGVTGGCTAGVAGATTTAYIKDERPIPNACYTWSGSAYTAQNCSSITGDLAYQGTWNASTNIPALTSSIGTNGYYYVVSMAGTTNLNGITTWDAGDWAVFSGTAWERVPVGASYISLVDTSPQTMAGPLNSPALNSIVSACTFSGATADVKLNAAIASISSGGVIDARCFGATTQTVASTVTWGASVSQTILWSQATVFEPSSATVQMFNPGPLAESYGLTINVTNFPAYSVPAILINSNARSQGQATLKMYDTSVVGTSAASGTAGSACLEIEASNVTTQSVSGVTINNFNCVGNYYGFELVASGGGFINGNVGFTNWTDSYSNIGLYLYTAGTSSQIAGNTFSNYLYEAGDSPQIGIETNGLSGSQQITDNVFSGLAIWDISGAGYWLYNPAEGNNGNIFTGYWAGPILDDNTGGAGGANQYQLGSSLSLNTLTTNSLTVNGLAMTESVVANGSAVQPVANQADLQDISGQAYIDSWGPNTTTAGSFKIRCLSSNASVDTTCASSDATGDWKIPGTFTAASFPSPSLTGTPTAPTAAVGTNTTQVANMAALQAALPVSNPITSATGGIGTGTVTCLTATCTNLRGTYSVVGGTFGTGTFLTLTWPATPTAYVCTATQGAGGIGDLEVGNSVATTTGMGLTNNSSMTSVTMIVNYSCQP